MLAWMTVQVSVVWSLVLLSFLVWLFSIRHLLVKAVRERAWNSVIMDLALGAFCMFLLMTWQPPYGRVDSFPQHQGARFHYR